MSAADVSRKIMERIAESMDDETFVSVFSPEGLAATLQYRECEDGFIIERTKTAVRGGKLDGFYAVFVFAPVGPGSRSGRGKASRWHRVKVERCKTRSESIDRAEALWYEHCPKLAKKHGKL